LISLFCSRAITWLSNLNYFHLLIDY
jgi:hypothetical protein